jgi:hypothetical protein
MCDLFVVSTEPTDRVRDHFSGVPVNFREINIASQYREMTDQIPTGDHSRIQRRVGNIRAMTPEVAPVSFLPRSVRDGAALIDVSLLRD